MRLYIPALQNSHHHASLLHPWGHISSNLQKPKLVNNKSNKKNLIKKKKEEKKPYKRKVSSFQLLTKFKFKEIQLKNNTEIHSLFKELNLFSISQMKILL